MVVVERGAFLEPQIVAIAIVPIVLQEGDVLEAQAVDDSPDDCVFPEPEPPATPITNEDAIFRDHSC